MFNIQLYNIILNLIISILTLVPVIISVAFFTLAERKIMASIQRRLGPNIIGFWGVLQPIADGLKLIIKELILPTKAIFFLFIIAPVITFFLSLINWTVIPFSYNNVYCDLNFGVLFFLCISSLGVYGIILAGYSSNSKYSFIGTIRTIAQIISYELILSLSILPVILLTNSLNFTFIVYFQEQTTYFVFTFFPAFIIFLIAMLAETNRTPFDLPEAEAELVAGYNVEYSSIIFAMFFLGEYSNMLLMACFCVIFFFGGWANIIILPEIFFAVKIIFFCFFFIFIRAQLPRYRYDQLMVVGWKILLPLGFGYLLTIINIIFFFNIKNLIFQNLNNTLFFIENFYIYNQIFDYDCYPINFLQHLYFYDYKKLSIMQNIF